MGIDGVLREAEKGGEGGGVGFVSRLCWELGEWTWVEWEMRKVAYFMLCTTC